MGTRTIRPPAFQKPSGMMYLSADQLNLVTDTETLVELDAIQAGFNDAIENVATHRITPGPAGFYSMVGQVRFDNVVALKDYHAEIRLNGAGAIQNNVSHASTTKPVTAICVVPNWYLAADDYIELWAEANADVNTVDIDATELRTFLAIQRVR